MSTGDAWLSPYDHACFFVSSALAYCQILIIHTGFVACKLRMFSPHSLTDQFTSREYSKKYCHLFKMNRSIIDQ